MTKFLHRFLIIDTRITFLLQDLSNSPVSSKEIIITYLFKVLCKHQARVPRNFKAQMAMCGLNTETVGAFVNIPTFLLYIGIPWVSGYLDVNL